MIDGGNIDASNMWFSDEAHFYLDSFLNKWNWRIWGSQNPHVCVPQSLYGNKSTVLAASSKSGIMGPIFLQDAVHSNLYAKILREFVAIQNDLELVANKYIVVHTRWCNPSRTPAVFILLEDE